MLLFRFGIALRLSATRTLSTYLQSGAVIRYAVLQSGSTPPKFLSSIYRSSSSLPEMTQKESERYQPFLLSPIPGAENDGNSLAVSEDWTADLDLDRAKEFAVNNTGTKGRLRILVLYGSLRQR